MTFKERLLEGETWDKVKEVAGNNKALAAGIGGAGLGALYNYASDGADDMVNSRNEDIENFRKEDVGEFMTDKNTMSKNTFNEFRDPALIVKGQDNYLTNKEDLYPLTSKTKMVHDLKSAIEKNPSVFGNENGDYSIFGSKVNPNISSDEAHEIHVDNIKSNFKNMPSGAINKAIESNPELSKEQTNLINNIGDAQADSYRNKILGGAALGAGGTYAARKLKERQG